MTECGCGENDGADELRSLRLASEHLLDSVDRWWAAHQDLANRPRIALTAWLSLSLTERNAIWQVGIAAVRNIQDLNEARVPIWILARRCLMEEALQLEFPGVSSNHRPEPLARVAEWGNQVGVLLLRPWPRAAGGLLTRRRN